MRYKMIRSAAGWLVVAGMLAGCGPVRPEPPSESQTQQYSEPYSESLVSQQPSLKRFDAQFLDLFDTVTSIVGYAEDKDTFTAYTQEFYDQLKEYHQLYDIYNEYEGINNLKTINDQAGIAPVKVDRRIIELLDFSIEMHQQSDGMVNIAMGSVLELWHSYRTAGIDNPETAQLPPEELLEQASRHTDIAGIVIDRENSTVFLSDPEMSLDVGSVGKGYATEQICQMLEARGRDHILVSVGGNVRAIGKRGDGTMWKVGVQNPDLSSEQTYLHTVDVDGQSLVTSGVYQRYYKVAGENYHHIVHPGLLRPWNQYQSVSIRCRDSGMADALTTAVFNMDLEEGKKFIEQLDGIEALWILSDGTEYSTAGFFIKPDVGKSPS